MKKTVLLLSFLVCALRAASAEPVSELAGFSVLGKVDLGELAKGEIKTAAGPRMNTPRYLSVQSVFVVSQPPAAVLAAMKHFDPTAHRELKVFLHAELPAASTSGNFSRLPTAPGNSAVKTLSEKTEKMASDLQVSKAEAQKFSAGKPVWGFWADLLAQRAREFASGGARAQAPYDHTSAAVQPGKELAGLVRQQGAVNKQFGSFLNSTGLLGGKGSLKPDLYWELLQVEDDGVLTLGASYTRGTSGGGYQLADGLYYASGGYDVALTLYQLWPVDVGGKPSTLVWRGDFISAASLGELHGIERIASEGAMKKDISKAVSAFKSEAAR
ncbi:MAG: hypothetical protein ACR2MW_11895 [Chthoniobacterales bacterium]